MKPTAAEIENGMPRSHSATMPPVSASGTPLKTSSASRAEPKRAEQQQEDQAEADRHDDHQPLRARRPGSRTARPSRASSPAGSFTCCAILRLRLGDERADVAAADVGLHDDAPLAVLAADLVRPFGERRTSRRGLSGTRRGRDAVSAPASAAVRQRDRQVARARRGRRAIASGRRTTSRSAGRLRTPCPPRGRRPRPRSRPARRRRSGRSARSPRGRPRSSSTGRPVDLLDLHVGRAADRRAGRRRSGWPALQHRLEVVADRPSPPRRRARRRSAR